jgi:tripartite-type tricarboxylate transporter receptor subunit TctC
MSKLSSHSRLGATVFSLLAAAGMLGAAPSLQAQQNVADFPSKPIRVIIPFAPGGGTDVTGRLTASKLQEAWGQPVLAENQAGANGTIGINAGAKASPDGYTITLVSSSSVINVYILPKVPYDLQRDFTPLSQLTAQPYALVVHPSVPAKNVKELIAYAKANPNKLNYGSSGIGGTSHLSGALLASLADIQLTHVPYKGGNPAMQDVIAGNIQMLFSTILQSQIFLKDGRLRALAVSTAKRSPAAPDLPTLSEAGVPGYEVAPWYGLLLPAKTPAPIVNKLNREIAKAMHMPDVVKKMSADGSQPVGGTPEEFGALLKTESVKWGKIVKDNNIRMD